MTSAGCVRMRPSVRRDVYFAMQLTVHGWLHHMALNRHRCCRRQRRTRRSSSPYSFLTLDYRDSQFFSLMFWTSPDHTLHDFASDGASNCGGSAKSTHGQGGGHELRACGEHTHAIKRLALGSMAVRPPPAVRIHTRRNAGARQFSLSGVLVSLRTVHSTRGPASYSVGVTRAAGVASAASPLRCLSRSSRPGSWRRLRRPSRRRCLERR